MRNNARTKFALLTVVLMLGIFFFSPALHAQELEAVEVTVTTAAGLAQGVRVFAFSGSGAYLLDTDADGKVSFELSVGQEYKFRADIMGSQYWSNVIIVQAGEPNLALIEAGGGNLQVTIETSSGVAMEGINSYLFTASGVYLGLAQVTDSTGNVTFSVPAGDYKVRADYLGNQFWSSETVIIENTNITVQIPHQDVTITIQGTYLGTPNPRENINVYLFTASGAYMNQNLATNSSGQVIFNLPEQPYKVRVDYLGQQFWSDEFTWQDTAINIPMAEAEITVTGSGLPLEGVNVYVFTASGTYLNINSPTDTDGKVSFNLPAGPYKFRADYQGSQYWSGEETLSADLVNSVTVSTGGGNFTLTVLKGAIDPLVGVNCYVFSESGAYLNMTATTDSSGQVSFALADGTYKFRVDHQGHPFWTEVYEVPTTLSGDFTVPNSDVTITVESVYQTSEAMEGVPVYLFTASGAYMNQNLVTNSSGQVTFNLPEQPYKVRADYLGQQFWSDEFTWQDTSINIPMAEAEITVTGSGLPLEGVDVYVFTASGAYLNMNGPTDTDGNVSFNLPAGPYKFRSDYQGNQYWSGEETLLAYQSNPIALSTGGGTFELTVLKGTSDPHEGVNCYVFSESGAYLNMSAATDANGLVSFSLADGTYKFRVDHLGNQFWTDVYEVPTTLLDNFLIPHQDVTISVLSSFQNNSSPIESVRVYLFTASGAYMGQNRMTDTSGQVLFSLPDQLYKVRVDYLGNQFWSSEFKSQDTTVTIPKGGAQVHVSRSGSAVAGANVYLFTETGSYLNKVNTTDSAGMASFSLPVGSYKFRADEGGEQVWSPESVISSENTTHIGISFSGVAISINAAPETITEGEASTLTWNSTHADSCVIEPDIGSVAINGSMSVSPTQSTTYTITALGSGGNAMSSATITVLPVVPFETKLFPSNGQEEDEFGESVCISGDYAFITGGDSVYVFKQDGGLWIEQTILTVRTGAELESVSTSGDYVIASDDGSGYIFKREGDVWTEHAILTVSTGDYLNTVVMDGNYIIASGDESAYIFKRDDDTWSEQAVLLPSDVDPDALFQCSVSISGDYAIVGMWRDSEKGSYAGAAYIFVRDGATWTEQQKLTAWDGEDYDGFGGSVSISGDYAIISVHGDRTARIYRREGSIWTEQAILSPSDPENVYTFGVPVRIIGDYAIVGAADGMYVGSAYVFRREGQTWVEQVKLSASDPFDFDSFGCSLDINDGYALIGASGDGTKGDYAGAAYIFPVLMLNAHVDPEIIAVDESSTLAWNSFHAETVSIDQGFGAVSNDGEIIVSPANTTSYTIAATGLGTTAIKRVTVNVPDQSLPPTVTISAAHHIIASGGSTTLTWNSTLTDTCTIEPDIGVVNINGSIIVSPIETTIYTVTATGQGGSSSSSVKVIVPWAIPDENKSFTLDSEPGDNFGLAVSLNGDHAIIGAPDDDANGEDSGSAYIFKKQGATWGEQQKLVPGDGEAGDHFGSSLSISGDYAIVGAPRETTTGYNSGAAYIFKRENETWTEQVKLISSDNQEYDLFGGSVSINGDYAIASGGGTAYVFKRDGVAWTEQTKLDSGSGPVHLSGEYAIIGSSGDSENGLNRGAAYIYKRNDDQWTRQAKIFGSGSDQVEYNFGQSVATNGEYAVVGAYAHAGQDYDSGAIHIFKREGTRWLKHQRLTASDRHMFQDFGESVSMSGDYIAVGAPGDSYNTQFFGAAYIYKKIGNTWTEQKKYIAGDQMEHMGFGHSVYLDNDHIIIGPGDNNQSSDSVYIYPVQTVDMGVDSESVLIGASTVLTWDCLHADSVIIDQGIGAVDISGSITLSPIETTTYAITATGPAGVTTEQITIVVIDPSVFPTVNIHVMPDIIELGGSTHLTWNSLNAQMCVIEPDIGRVSASGSIDVSPEMSTTYTISATGPQGTAKANAEVSLLPSADISVSPSSIRVGDSTTLTWNTLNADSCVIEPDIGSVDVNGSIEVWPTDVTTYTITATNEVGTAVESVLVTVTAAVEISASPEAIAVGESSILTWTSTSADTCIIEPDIGSVDPNGSMAVSPSTTTTYTITGTGLGGIGTDSVTVTVHYSPNVTLSANPETVLLGDDVTLTWNVSNADTVSIDQGIGTVDASGSITLSPGETTTYTITATGPGGTTTKEVTVTVTSLSAINITSPLFGETLSRPDIMVTGTITHVEGSEVGVTVNGMVAMVYEDEFVANHVPLEQGGNIIKAIAVDVDGNTLETSILVNVVAAEKYVMLTGDEYEGVSPFEIKQTIDASFDAIDQTLSHVSAPDGTVELIEHPSDTEYYLRVTGPGIYYLIAAVTDEDSNSYSDTIGVVVLDEAIVDGEIRSRWNSMKEKLIQGDIQGALKIYTPLSVNEYEQTYTALGSQLPALIATMGDMEKVYIKGDRAKYKIRRNEEIDGQTYNIAYHIYFLKDPFGRWCVDVF